MTRFSSWALAGVAAVLATAAAGACGGDGVPNYPILIDPCDGGTCIPATASANVGVGVSSSASSVTSSSASTGSSASSSAGSSSGAGGASTTSDLRGTVDRITSPTFADSGNVYAGALTVEVFPASGSQVNAAYGGDAGAGFDAVGIAPGKVWLVALVAPDASMGAAGVWSTVSAVTAPQISSVTLPILDAQMIQGIAATLPSLSDVGVSASASHVVIVAQHAGAPYVGLAITGDTGGATVAYDTGPGSYSDTATETGSGGTILLFNSSLSGMTRVTVMDPKTSITTSLPILAGGGAFTVLSVDL